MRRLLADILISVAVTCARPTVAQRYEATILMLALLPCASNVATNDDGGGTQEEMLQDVSNEICWTGSWTKQDCCQGDATTHPECWDSAYTFEECCPNADCWDGDILTYSACCGEKHGKGGNPGCWSGAWTYDHCCLAKGSSQSWVDSFFGIANTEQFYAMDEFYTDSQYGNDFGYYSTGHVLRPKDGKGDDQETQQFAHYTTYPMALSPHFARVFCRLLFVMWVQLRERAPFRVVEMGAGSGQLAYDVQQCVRSNQLGISPPVWRRWAAAFEYVIMERSPALARRQRERGLRVVSGDAQSGDSCRGVLAALALSSACSGGAAKDAPECVARDRGTPEAGASVVLSNELLDAFAPVKLRISLYGQPDVTDCHSWHEVRLVHAIRDDDLLAIGGALGYPSHTAEEMLEHLRQYTEMLFCGMANSTIGQAAREALPKGTSCLAIVFGLNEMTYRVELRVPAASHNMRFRLRKDKQFWAALRAIVKELDTDMDLSRAVVLPRQTYRQLRHDLRTAPDLEVKFLELTQTHRLSVSLGEGRCDKLEWWFVAHKSRITRLVRLYQALGYPAVYLLVRPGEQDFVDLADCLLGDSGGFMLSVDYGASFEALGYSLSVDPKDDGIFIPPVPQELMRHLPHCHSYWPKCAGRIDWTTFVDFTNIAAAGERRGWRKLFYGPQSLLEQVSRMNFTVGDNMYSVPGYSLVRQARLTSHVRSWCGRETLASADETSGWQQRWTSFKALLLEKPSGTGLQPFVVAFPSWHLDIEEIDMCWRIDPTMVPLADWIHRQGAGSPRKAFEVLTEQINDRLGREYAVAYEEAQLAARIVDWFIATGGCESLSPRRASSLLGSRGLWLSLRTRLLRAWEAVWGADALERIALDVLRRLADPEGAVAVASPPECIGQQTYARLCGALPVSGAGITGEAATVAEQERQRALAVGRVTGSGTFAQWGATTAEAAARVQAGGS